MFEGDTRTAPKAIVRVIDNKRMVRSTTIKINECELPPSFLTGVLVFFLLNNFKMIPPKQLAITNPIAIIS
jgi:hypothetical protein